VWSYGPETQVLLEKFIRLRLVLKPYIAELAANVTATGVPTMRPLSYEFPEDPQAYGHNGVYMLGPEYLVAPVTTQNATTKQVYFPAGASWKNYFTQEVHAGGTTAVVDAPLETIPVFKRM
jgi:alpha-D-xyloside xylohydrolase